MSDDLLETFLTDGEEHLERINNLFVQLEQGGFDQEEQIEELLRELHSMKGSARMVGAQTIETITHATETIIKNINSGNEEFNPEMMNLFFEVVDALQASFDNMNEQNELLEPSELDLLSEKLNLFVDRNEKDPEESKHELVTENPNPDELRSLEKDELTALASDLGIDSNQPRQQLVDAILSEAESTESGASEPKTGKAPSSPDETPTEPNLSNSGTSSYDVWDPNDFEESMVNDYLTESGEMLDQLTNNLIELEQNVSAETINSIFRAAHTIKGSSGMIGLAVLEDLAHDMEELLDDVRDGALEVTSELIDLLLLCRDFIEQVLQKIENFEPVQVQVEQLLSGIKQFKKKGSVNTKELRNQTKLGTQAEELMETEDQEESDGSGDNQSDTDTRSESIRVDIGKLDKVINLVGEMVINRGRMEQNIDELKELQLELQTMEEKLQQRNNTGNSSDNLSEEMRLLRRAFDDVLNEIEQSTDDRGRVESELQESIMRTRMVPVAELFNKFPRLVRDLSQQTGKDVDLRIQGKQTELDKSVIEKISDPLMHIIRNSIDHGIESPEERARNGKPQEGTLRIEAKYVGDLVVIEIEDDGAGIQTEKVKETALDRDIASESEISEMDQDEIQELIFEPGFSTQEEVSETSGRGVGMDVVRSNIRDLNGSIDMQSTEGKGTKFTIKLPLTVAIIEVLLVQVQERRFALPVSSVSETLRVREDDIQELVQQEVFELRGRSIPILRLSKILGFSDPRKDKNQDIYPMVVVESENQEIGILVDDLIKKQEIVIKNLGSLIDNVQFASGATIMGDGEIVLIIDVGEIIQNADNLESSARPDQDDRLNRSDSAESQTSDVTNRQNQTVLVVEDTATQRQVIHETLESAGFETIIAEDGSDGLEMAMEHNIDFVTSDIRMPNMDGYELTEELRSRDEFSTVPILLISSLDEKIDRMKGFDAGADGYLEKPFNEEDLIQKVEGLLRSVG